MGGGGGGHDGARRDQASLNRQSARYEKPLSRTIRSLIGEQFIAREIAIRYLPFTFTSHPKCVTK